MSFPRIRPYEGDNILAADLKDRDLVQLICAFRIFNHELEITLSTRESPDLRENLLPLGITTMSAGSKTNPGGTVMRLNLWSNFPSQMIARLMKSPPYSKPKDMTRCGKTGTHPTISTEARPPT